MPTILDNIVAHKHREILEKKAGYPFEQLAAEVAAALPPGRFAEALKTDRQSNDVKLILEIKPASPSAGELVSALDLDKVLAGYNRYGAAISVLTDQAYFKGSLGLLGQVVQDSPLPVLCKDFILDPYQVYDARRAGAAAVLLIVKILPDDALHTLADAVRTLGMTPVVEIQNETELARALAVRPEVLLINNRNLETFDISFETTARLAPQTPQDIVVVSASGIGTRADIESLQPFCSAFLIGSSLMKTAPDQLEAKLRELSGRAD